MVCRDTLRLVRYTQHLREAAAAARDLAREARERGGPGAEEAAQALELKAADVERLADAIEAALTDTNQSGKPGEMVPAARLRISKGSGKGRKQDPLVVAANAAGFTLRSLAERIGCSHSHLYQARRGTVGMRGSWAREIEKLTGFAASKTNWRLLNSDE